MYVMKKTGTHTEQDVNDNCRRHPNLHAPGSYGFLPSLTSVKQLTKVQLS